MNETLANAPNAHNSVELHCVPLGEFAEASLKVTSTVSVLRRGGEHAKLWATSGCGRKLAGAIDWAEVRESPE
jgi:hypothetical protein